MTAVLRLLCLLVSHDFHEKCRAGLQALATALRRTIGELVLCHRKAAQAFGLTTQFIQERFRVFHICGVEALIEPVVDSSENGSRLVTTSVIAEQSGEAHCSP